MKTWNRLSAQHNTSGSNEPGLFIGLLIDGMIDITVQTHILDNSPTVVVNSCLHNKYVGYSMKLISQRLLPSRKLEAQNLVRAVLWSNKCSLCKTVIPPCMSSVMSFSFRMSLSCSFISLAAKEDRDRFKYTFGGSILLSFCSCTNHHTYMSMSVFVWCICMIRSERTRECGKCICTICSEWRDR